ncbi:(2Fe-2S) ferredoxin domain-containing protein [Hoyosella sp. YIM 151337]|uniref:(2Fe-2S) ferredoxin domain-containing protein n=1 Tax=Hoyosella sp. YIM 151337 TaxID=2992742 RepID=UPI002236651C|nr:(2Fe-2S) ferredoxin domain-containing protein [Hoyosella sp. YIM 151337]MCW4353555.1 (2Fe-2S) ferredoxin domain-containing protein [Hoyosella sp. YIM 151337]
MRSIILVARPTPSGVDIPSVARLAERVGADYALLDHEEPSIHTKLDEAAKRGSAVTLVPLGIPRDRYLETWIARAVANWRETRDLPLEITLTKGVDTTEAFAALVARHVEDGGEPITASPGAFRSPAWSEIPQHDKHMLVCRGPRCTVYGAGAVHRSLKRAFPDALITPTGCLTPCNLGPLVITYPDGEWHCRVSPFDEIDTK